AVPGMPSMSAAVTSSLVLPQSAMLAAPTRTTWAGGVFGGGVPARPPAEPCSPHEATLAAMRAKAIALRMRRETDMYDLPCCKVMLSRGPITGRSVPRPVWGARDAH